MEQTNYPLVALLSAYYWFDEGLQAYLKGRGWPTLSRAQSLIMVHVCQGVTRPSEIARKLGLTRQAVHATIGQIIEIGMFALTDDPSDRRTKVVVLTKMGAAMRRDARRAMKILTDRLSERISKPHVEALLQALSQEWGEPFPKAAPSRRE